MKKKVITAALILLVILAFIGYFLLSGILKENAQAKIVLSQSEKYQMIKKSILDEYDRCQGFISQSKGDFGSFEYCKRFIDWTNSQQITN